jgi:hypothetical protein
MKQEKNRIGLPRPTLLMIDDIKTTSTSKCNKNERIVPVQRDDDLFDPTKLRVNGNLANGIGVEKLLTTVPVRRPGRQSFVRVHPDEAYRLDTVLLELKDEGETYLLAAQLAAELPGARVARLHLYVDRAMNPAFWPIPLPGADGRENECHRSARIAAGFAMERWVRLEADRALGCYKTVAATGVIEEPLWPRQTLKELLKIAFGEDRFIRTVDHPIARRLRGEA